MNPQRWSALASHLDELLVLTPQRRDLRLAEIAANDPVTADQLRELLAARADASRIGFLAGLDLEGLAPPPAAFALQAGSAVGAWTLVEAIGEGGMGAVWLARRSDGRYDGEAAIKLLKSGRFEAAAQERFRREGGILARLHHPGIAQLQDAGVTPQGQPYLVLELVQGQRIDRWCAVRAYSVRQRIGLFLQVLEAVQAAHAQLVIHRDLKPSNILVDDDGRAKLLDFGIARLLPEAQADQTALTREGSYALTPEYAAPEQFEGGVLSVATDVYGLGVVLFELLGGGHPTGLPPGSAPMQYMRCAVDGRHRRASEANAAARGELRGDLDNILAKALRAQPAQRYASVAALAEDLRAHLAYRPVSARPDAWLYRAGRYARRNRLVLALGCAAVVAAVAGVAATAQQAREAQAQAAQARLQEQRALQAAAESARLRGVAETQTRAAEAQARLAAAAAAAAQAAAGLARREQGRADLQADRARAAAQRAERERDRAVVEFDFAESTTRLMYTLLSESGDEPVTPTQLMDRAAATIDAQYANDPVQRSRLLAAIAFQYVQMGKGPAARPLLEQAYALVRSQGDSEGVAALDCQAALIGNDTRPVTELIAQLDGAIGVLQQRDDKVSTTLANCVTARSLLHRVAGHAAAALADAERALALFGNPRPAQRLSALSAHSARATALGMLGRSFEAVSAYRHIVAELRATGSGSTVKAAINLNNLGSNLAAAGQTREAAEALQQSLDLSSQQRGGGSSWALLADLQALLGDGRAADSLQRAREDARLNGTPRVIGVVALQSANALWRLAEWDACDASLQEARKALLPLLPAVHGQRATVDLVQARLDAGRGRFSAARAALDRAMALQQQAQTQGVGLVHTALLDTELKRRSGDLPAARAALERAGQVVQRLVQGFDFSEHAGQLAWQSALLLRVEGQPARALAEARAARLQFAQSLGSAAPATRAAAALVDELAANGTAAN
jgi:hypothetical protein